MKLNFSKVFAECEFDKFTCLGHADREAFGEATRLTRLASLLVNGACVGGGTHVGGRVALRGPLEKGLAALARVDAVVVAACCVRAHLAYLVLDLDLFDNCVRTAAAAALIGRLRVVRGLVALVAAAVVAAVGELEAGVVQRLARRVVQRGG